MPLGCGAHALSPLPLPTADTEKHHQVGQRISTEHATLADALCACGAVGEDWRDAFRAIAERILSGDGDWMRVHGRSMVSDPSAIQQVAAQLHLVISQADTGVTRIEAAAQAIGEAYDVLDAVAHRSQDAELLKTVHQFNAARQQINELLAVFNASREAVQMYLDTLQVSQPAVQATPVVEATVPAQPRQRTPVQHRDGSYYPAAAGWAIDLLPRRVREGEEHERTVGQVMLAGSFAGQMTSGRDGVWTPEIQRRMRILGIRVRIRVENHVEMKVAQMMIHTGNQPRAVRFAGTPGDRLPPGSRTVSSPWIHPDRARHDPAGAAVLLDLPGAGMTTTELTSLAAHDEIEISTIRQPGDLTKALANANDQRGSSSGRVWFLVTNPDVKASCLVVGVRGDVGALEWIDDERLVPAHGLNAEWATYYTVHLHDNSMPPHAELPITTVFAVAEEYVRTGRRPTCVEWMPATA